MKTSSYAVKATTAADSAVVVTVDEEKAELIREAFGYMTEIVYDTESYEVTGTIETTDEQGNTIEQKVTVTKPRLLIDIKNKTAAEAAVRYSLNADQIVQLNDLTRDDTLWIFISPEEQFNKGVNKKSLCSNN